MQLKTKSELYVIAKADKTIKFVHDLTLPHTYNLITILSTTNDLGVVLRFGHRPV